MGTIEIPIVLMGKQHTIEALVCPQLSQEAILGIDVPSPKRRLHALITTEDQLATIIVRIVQITWLPSQQSKTFF